MKLFDVQIDPERNLLPKDGIVNYYGILFDSNQATVHLNVLMDKIQWKQDELFMFGRRVITKRKVAWYGDKPYKYTYSQSLKTAQPWTEELLRLKNRVEEVCGERFNSCLLNLYHSGSEGMGWHSDDEKELKPNGAIASLSFGASRKFVFKHKASREKVELQLDPGSLVLMKGLVQTHWLHSLPVSKKIISPRINLTFRTIL
ncbi:alpha-ketoglutarate-dependent dioxygenase AlkB family protein [Lutimonas zeaxanthinifaciens]|uniref:alpha-ketoglutarate-dependent dioxygenase AlkB family protein n=1 Tax=Lutimonas zeaxanthinifaciens TaxID=3060215 RepID=UPI00265CB4E7|nr:alpha-ketoglutarate-dependent dioxygenase AlkB [Lutimonas sp. YSD2104]WKK64989.1 alpha-ketoglutarate-dependent dioxygenase AlkB [Lutimonas sp. YSD2104]